MAGRSRPALEERRHAVADIQTESAVGNRASESEPEGIDAGKGTLLLRLLIDRVGPEREVAIPHDGNAQMPDRVEREMRSLLFKSSGERVSNA